MKINVNYARKAGRENYGSENFSLAIETEPPPEIAQDREKLRGYVEALFDEVKARVEDQIIAAGEREPAPDRHAPEVSENGSRRAPPPRTAVRSMRRPAPNGSGHAHGQSNGRGAPNGEGVSLKQIGYMRSLARDARLSNDQLALFVEEIVGRSCSLNGLLKHEGSAVIEALKANAA